MEIGTSERERSCFWLLCSGLNVGQINRSGERKAGMGQESGLALGATTRTSSGSGRPHVCVLTPQAPRPGAATTAIRCGTATASTRRIDGILYSIYAPPSRSAFLSLSLSLLETRSTGVRHVPADPRGLVPLAAPVLALRPRWHRLALPGCVHDVSVGTYCIYYCTPVFPARLVLSSPQKHVISNVLTPLWPFAVGAPNVTLLIHHYAFF
ncbi:hypothetical protein VTN00DRAFT_1253 [Thermoascus crustaceus]|uniref:uncharacterized protein n=1 Tax=Thermoascus crustaceus TaxID=5088 RepID=UPI003743B827